ncbi:MAG: hypothetical protein K5860_01640 [Bacteroidales bacterium]|nr:hypothetical protein [Bacteroidales bacterium]
MKLFSILSAFLLITVSVSAQNTNGAILAEFSVSDSTKVYFSQGNLQYQASTGTWRFAEHQWDFVGDSINGNVYENGVKSDNLKISPTYDGWIDLFGWGTSGYNGKNPYMTSTSYSDYGDGSNDIAGTNYDWGVYNKISNGGNSAGMWHTLTNSEWNYVISNRSDARYLRGTATVNGVNGLILLPDNWTLPTGVTFTYGEGGWSQNTYSASDWSKMEANGAVFLPAAGYRFGTDVYGVSSGGDYWSSSAYDFYNAGCLYFFGDYVEADYGSRDYGLSVRLVQDVK